MASCTEPHFWKVAKIITEKIPMLFHLSTLEMTQSSLNCIAPDCVLSYVCVWIIDCRMYGKLEDSLVFCAKLTLSVGKQIMRVRNCDCSQTSNTHTHTSVHNLFFSPLPLSHFRFIRLFLRFRVCAWIC
jgi:hypothetical protein